MLFRSYSAPERPQVSHFIAGVGGRDVTPAEVRRMFEALLAGDLPAVRWVDLEMEEVDVHG